jgi:predicted PurR-regulated permease PerM
MPSASRRDTTLKPLLAIIVFFLVAFALYVTRPVIVPVLFAVFLTILVQPMVARLNRRLPYWLSLVIVLLTFTVLIGFVGIALVTSIGNVGARMSEYSHRIEGMLSHSSQWIKVNVLSRVVEFARSKKVELKQPDFGVEENIKGLLGFVRKGFTSVVSLLAQASVVVILTVFALVETKGLADRIRRVFGAERGGEILDVLEPMGESIQQYLRTKTLVSLVTGGVVYIACLAIGIEFAFVWGTLVFLFNYLPYVGPVVAVLPAIAMAFLQYDSPARGIVAALVLGAIQWLSGSVIEPQIMGHSLKVSVLFLLVSMIFWGWFWGLAGVVLAIPLSSAVVIACSHVDRLKPIAALLSATPPGEEGVPGNGQEEERKGGKEAETKAGKKPGRKSQRKG